ncbi:hypothetical protein [Asanoa siamensis]|nr:hypothetical protein [Asanoa siamensis]
MSADLAKLLGAASRDLADDSVDRAALPPGPLGDQLARTLGERNGFFAFESALLLRPLGSSLRTAALGLTTWNAADTWKTTYHGRSFGDVTFFAEDLFGGQFGITSDAIVSLNPEVGELEHFAGSIDEWATRILDDYDVLTGYPLAHEWQRLHGPLAPGTRLVPRQPFTVGGEFEVANLVAVAEVKAMRIYGGIATTLAGVPDGSEVTFRIENSGAGSDAHRGEG